MGNLSDFQTILWPETKVSNVGFYRKPYAGFPSGSVIQAPFTRAGAGRKVIDASGNLVDAAANVPAWTFPIGGSSAGCPYLSFLPSVENLFTYSEQFDNAAWVKSNSSITANATTSPDGTANADELIEDSATSTHFIQQSASVSATDYTMSCFVKYNSSRNWVYLNQGGANARAYFDIQNGVVGTTTNAVSASITNCGNGWYHCVLTATQPTATSRVFLVGLADADNSDTYTGDGTSGIYAWGAMLKEGSYISPLDYIPTEASAVTRAQDSITNISDLITSGYLSSTTEGTIVLQVGFDSIEASGTSNAFTFEDGSNNDLVGLRTSTSGIQIYDYVNAAIAHTLINQGGLHRVVIAYDASGVDIAVNGFDEYSASGAFAIEALEDMLADVGLNVKMLNFDPTKQTASERTSASSWPSAALMISDLGYTLA